LREPETRPNRDQPLDGEGDEKQVRTLKQYDWQVRERKFGVKKKHYTWTQFKQKKGSIQDENKWC
jgi:hypothetical protein